MTATKESKLDRLKRQLASAKAKLAAEEPRLKTTIDAHNREFARLKKLADDAEKAAKRARERHDVVRKERWTALGLGAPALAEKLAAHALVWGGELADAERVHSAYAERALAADPDYVAARDAEKAANKAYELVQWAPNKFDRNPTGCHATRALRDLRDAVGALEHEIERYPAQIEAARERRAEERRAREDDKRREEINAATQKAIDALATAPWANSEEKTS